MEASARRKGTKGRNRSRRMPRITRVVDRVSGSISGNFRGEMRGEIAILDPHWIVCAEVCEGAKRGLSRSGIVAQVGSFSHLASPKAAHSSAGTRSEFALSSRDAQSLVGPGVVVRSRVRRKERSPRSARGDRGCKRRYRGQ